VISGFDPKHNNLHPEASMKRARFVSISMFLLLFLVSLHAAGQQAVAPPQGIERVTSVEGITEYRLQNGLRVLMFPDPSKATITVNITYLVGSMHENYGETGMAHLLEHMVFKGTKRHPNIPKELQDHGSRPNGTTSYDRTNYFETFQATDANLEWALDLESDRMVNSFILKTDLDSEMTVVRNEFEAGENSPLGVLQQRVFSTAYLWHNYGKSVIGSRADIENVPIDRLQAFYRNYYQPDNAILVVAGKIDEARTLGLIAKYFAPIPRPQRVLPKIYTVEPTQDGERTVTLRRVGDVQNIVLAYHVPPGSHPDIAAMAITSLILAENSPSSRLYKALVETKKASNIGGGNLQLREAGLGIIVAEVRKESSLDDARATLLATLDGIRTNPLTVEEVERARNRLLTNIDLQLNNSEQIALGLSNWASMGDWRLFFLNRDRIKSVSAEDVQRAAVYHTKPSNRTIGVFIPEAQPDRTEIAAAPDLVTVFKDYKGSAAVSSGEAFDASPDNIEARLRRAALPGGIKLTLLPKKTRGEAVVALLNMRFGNEQNLTGQSVAGRMTAQMLMRGTTKRTRQQIQDELDRLKARMGVGGSAAGVTANIETVRGNLAAVLALAAEVLKEPAFPSVEFESLRQQILSGIESQRTEPTAIALVEFQRHMSTYPKGDIRYVATFDEQVEEARGVTIDQLKQFHSGFYGGSDSEVTIIGDFDADEAQKLIQSHFASWKSPKPYAQVKTPYRKIEPVNRSFEAPDKANAFFLAGMRINIRDTNTDYPAMVLGNYILGSGINSRLFARIRGKEGLSYGIGSNFNVAPEDDNGTFLANAISAPENSLKVEASFRDEIGIILKNGFTPAEITAAKDSWVQAQQVSRAQDRELVGRLGTLRFYNRTMAWDADLQRKIQALTPQQIVDAMRKYMDVSAMTFVKAGDFKKAAAKTQ
jgi:zinc protease